MAKDPAVLFYISDWLTSTSEMDSDCKGWYLNLILHNYDKGSLPNDLEKLAVLANVKFSEYARFEQVFEQVLKNKFQQIENNRLTNLKTQTILKNRELFKDKRSESGKLSYFLKFCRNNHGKQMTNNFEKFIKDNINISDLDTKNKHMLEHMFEHLLELYRNENENENINKDNNENINEIYNKYPNKCSIKDRSTGKTSKHKEKIKKLLNKYTKEDLIKRIEDYVKDCYNTNTYLKNFGTFLNNLPEPFEDTEKEDLATKVVKVFQVIVKDYVVIDMQKEREAALKLIKAYKTKYPQSLDDELLESMNVYFNQIANIQDDWIKNNLSLSYVVNNFNAINNNLKNGKSKQKGVSQEFRKELYDFFKSEENDGSGY